jgi:hypothetical protein
MFYQYPGGHMRKAGVDKRIGNVIIRQSGYIVSEEDMQRLICESIFSIAGRKEADLKPHKPSLILDTSYHTEEAS